MKQYYYITGKELPELEPEPTLSDFYTPRRSKEKNFIIGGMALMDFK